MQHRAGQSDAARPRAGPPHEPAPRERIHSPILHRNKEGIEEALAAAGVRERPVEILNEVLQLGDVTGQLTQAEADEAKAKRELTGALA